MNTLLPNSLLDKIRRWPQMIDALNALSQKKSPYDIEGLNSGACCHNCENLKVKRTVKKTDLTKHTHL